MVQLEEAHFEVTTVHHECCEGGQTDLAERYRPQYQTKRNRVPFAEQIGEKRINPLRKGTTAQRIIQREYIRTELNKECKAENQNCS